MLQILTLLGSLAMFLYGMSLMSGGLQKMADLLDAAYVAMDHKLATPLIELRDIRNAEEAEQAINVCREMGDFIINISQSVIEAKNV